jgi:hypothetical protein
LRNMSQNEDLAASLCDSIAGQHNEDNSSLGKGLSTYFDKSKLVFTCPHEDQFKSLRENWKIRESEYRKSFQGDNNDAVKGSALVSKGDMGFSGSSFFNTNDGKYLVKSVPRHFEHSFFRDEMLVPYANHMRQNLASLLVRITDFLEAKSNISSTLGMAPAHHIVMENTKFGEEDDKRNNVEWETWDLKPMSYFYPERDVADGALASEETKSRLADNFSGKLTLSLDDAEDLKANLQKDTAFLAKSNAVDYSLFLVRIPLDPENPKTKADGSPEVPIESPIVPPAPPTWRTGVKSADGKYIYRACVLDFFWAKHKVQAQAMTGLINTYNLVGGHGPMSVTTTSEEYRERFLKMCEEMIEVS